MARCEEERTADTAFRQRRFDRTAELCGVMAGVTSGQGIPSFSVVQLSIVGVALGVLLAGLAVAELLRQRRLLSALMERLDRVEGEAPPPPVTVGGQSEAQRKPAPEADVLAGRTSYVAAMVEGVGGGATSLADRTIWAIHRRLQDPIAPGDLADELNISLRTLERVIAATLDCTPRQLILTMKMREARRLLRDGELRVGEVAHRLGFPDAAYFSTRFKLFYGHSPSTLLRAENRRRV